MARSPDRRPGFSRRAQYGIFTGYVVAVLGIVAGVVVLVVSLLNPGAFAFARTTASEVARPLGQAGATSRTAGQSVFAAIGAYFNAGRQNAALAREVQAARANAVTMHALAQENAGSRRCSASSTSRSARSRRRGSSAPPPVRPGASPSFRSGATRASNPASPCAPPGA